MRARGRCAVRGAKVGSDVLKRLSESVSGTTHWEGCEEVHIKCALGNEITRLRKENERLADAGNAMRSELFGFQCSSVKIQKALDGWENARRGK